MGHAGTWCITPAPCWVLTLTGSTQTSCSVWHALLQWGLPHSCLHSSCQRLYCIRAQAAQHGRLLGTATPAAALIWLPMNMTPLGLRCHSSLSAGLSSIALFCKGLSSFKQSLPVLLRPAVHLCSAGSPATGLGTEMFPYLTEGICVAIVHHVEAAVHVHSHRRPLCRQVAAAPADCTRAGSVRLLLQESTGTGCTGQLCRGFFFERHAMWSWLDSRVCRGTSSSLLRRFEWPSKISATQALKEPGL